MIFSITASQRPPRTRHAVSRSSLIHTWPPKASKAIRSACLQRSWPPPRAPFWTSSYRTRIADWHERFRQRGNEGRATTDLARAARAATFGAVQSLLVDMDRVVNGTVDETDGAIAFADGPSAETYGVVDEIARRVLLTGGEVLSVRAADLPEDPPLAAILRYAL